MYGNRMEMGKIFVSNNLCSVKKFQVIICRKMISSAITLCHYYVNVLCS